MCVCVFFPFILDIKFVGRISRDHTGGRSHRIFHPPSAVRALIFLARSIQPFLSLVEHEVEFCVLTISPFSTRRAIFIFFFSEKNPVYRDRTHVPTCQKVMRLPLSYRGEVPGMCVCVCFLPIHSGHQVRWTYQPGSHRRKVTLCN